MLIKILLIIKKSIEYLLFVIMLTLMVTLGLHVLLRYFFRYSFSWTSELSTYLLVWLTFLGASTSMLNGEDLCFDLLYEKANKKLKLVLIGIKNIIIILFLGTICFYGIPVIKMGFKFKAITFPVSKGFLYLVVPVAFGLMLVYTCFETILLFFPKKLELFYQKIRE